MATAKSSYHVTPANGSSEYDVEGDKYEYDLTTGRHLIYKGEELVANIINASVVKNQPAS